VATETTANGSGASFVAVYHDTPDRRLARAQIALRRSLRNGTGLWEAEIGDEVVAAPGGPATLPDELAARLTAPLRNSSLVEVARLRLGSEDVALLEGQHVLRTYATLDRALHDTVVPPREQQARRGSPAVEHVRVYLRAQLAEIERTDPLIRSSEDPEAVHDLRVAVRRMRSVLRTTRALYDPDWLDALRAELDWLGSSFGPLRDLDVLLADLRKEVDADALPVLKLLEGARRRARKRAVATLESERYVKLLDRLAAAVDAPPVRSSDLSLEAAAGNEFRKLCRAAKKLRRRATAAEVHKARIRAKRARYAAELVEPLTGKRARRFIKESKRFQDVVGAHQDAVVAADRIRGVVERSKSTETAFAAGRLAERTTARRREALRKIPAAWKRVERRGRKAWA
jgi:CHAD domain-containing protein